jgi:hypothetical protein
VHALDRIIITRRSNSIWARPARHLFLSVIVEFAVEFAESQWR